MKNQILILMAMLGVTAMRLEAQSGIVYEQHVPLLNTSTITRWNTDETYVTCSSSKLNNQSMITYVEEDSHCTRILLDQILIEDMVVANDSVFFCGKDVENDCGFIGHCSIQSFRDATHTYTKHTDFIYDLYSVMQDITKFTTYEDQNGQRHLFCIGKGTDSNHLVFLDYRPNVTGPNQYNYVVNYIIYSNQTIKDLDVAYTDRVVVVGGLNTENIYNSKIVLWAFDADDPITLSMQLIRHTYNDLPHRYILNRGLVLQGMTGSSLVAAMTYTTRLLGTTPAEAYVQYTNVALIDGNSLLTNMGSNGTSMQGCIELRQHENRQSMFPLSMAWNMPYQELLLINGYPTDSIAIYEPWDMQKSNCFNVVSNQALWENHLSDVINTGVIMAQSADYSPSGNEFIVSGAVYTYGISTIERYIRGNNIYLNCLPISGGMLEHQSVTTSTDTTEELYPPRWDKSVGEVVNATLEIDEMHPFCFE